MPFEPDNLIVLLSSLMALLLFVIALLAYMRERRRKLLLVTGAFFFYFLMGFLDATEALFPNYGELLELLASSFNFIVLLLFSIALLTKE
ncbi:hypothetical protein [Methanococcoides sp. FTZ1]|uniref:hypothetical protein n=1 Tax=Methanococcoides sp. FTZ1 TaxID=3439061 RepID=UPI003F87B1D4